MSPGIECIEQSSPARQTLPTGEVRVEHLPSPGAHFRNRLWRIEQLSQCGGQRFAVVGRDGKTASMALHQPAKFTVRIADDDDGLAGGGDAIKLARHHQAFEPRIERHPMGVGGAEGIRQQRSGLIGQEAERAGNLGEALRLAEELHQLERAG